MVLGRLFFVEWNNNLHQLDIVLAAISLDNYFYKL